MVAHNCLTSAPGVSCSFPPSEGTTCMWHIHIHTHVHGHIYINKQIYYLNFSSFYVYECIFEHNIYAWFPRRPYEGIISPGTEVNGGCKLTCGCWVLEEQLLFLPVEPSLQPQQIHFENVSHMLKIFQLNLMSRSFSW